MNMISQNIPRPEFRGFLRIAHFVLLCGLLFLFSSRLYAQRELKDIPDPDPELERAAFKVADGFDVNLFASDPLIAKPIQMNFDSAGRLWIASSEVYPHIVPGKTPTDRILIVEDADGDGTAEKVQVFAEGLLIPTAVIPYGLDAAYVANSTELLFLKDTDGDGKADHKTVVLSGFGTEDTHHILHTFRYGPEGLLYFNQSIYIHSHIETPYGIRRLGGGGIWHFHPQRQQLEVYARGFVNPWGHHHDAWGQSFATDGAFGEGINYVFPGATFVTAPGATRILAGMNPGSPKHCSLEIVDGGHLPDDWQGNMITNDFRAHRVCRFAVTESQSGYASREMPELVTSTHVAFRPVDVKQGPDGAIYLADWYNPIIQHGEVDFRDPRRDHVHGRIWRLYAKDRPTIPRSNLPSLSVEELLDQLKSTESWTRHHAKLVLAQQKESVAPKLRDWVLALDPKDPSFEHHRLEALWMYQALDQVDEGLLRELLKSSDHRVRAAATRVVYHWYARFPEAFNWLSTLIDDDHPRVRLEAVRALAQMRTLPSLASAMRALDHPMDNNLDFALWLTVRESADVWLPEMQAGRFDFGGHAHYLEFAFKAAESQAIVDPLVALLESGRVAKDQQLGLWKIVAAVGNDAQLGRVLAELLATAQNDTDRQLGLLQALNQAARQRRTIPAGSRELAIQFLDSSNEQVVQEAARLIGDWELTQARDRLEALAVADSATQDTRDAALDGLAQLGGKESADILAKLVGDKSSTPLRIAATQRLAALDLDLSSKAAVELIEGWDRSNDVAPVIHAFLSRTDGDAALIKALTGRKLPLDAAKLAVRAVRTSVQPSAELVAAFSSAGGLAAASTVPSPERVAELTAQVKARGNPRRGEAVFRREDQLCFKCHAIGGSGGQVGPDLASIGASAQPDYLVESLLNPNKAVKENYHSLIVTTDQGEIMTGVKVRETQQELVLRNAEDVLVTIPIDQIDERANGNSLMPVGLNDTLTEDEFIDLVRFLSELGKVGDFALGNAQVVRKWEVLLQDRGSNPRWISRYSQVSGRLPLKGLPTVGAENSRAIRGRFGLEIARAGTVTLQIDGPKNVTLDVDGVQLKESPSENSADGTVRHEWTFAAENGLRHVHCVVSGQEFAEGTLRCELISGDKNSAAARFVGGK